MVPAIFGNWGMALRADQTAKPINALPLGQWHLGLAHLMARRAPAKLPRGDAQLTYTLIPPAPVRMRRP